MVLDSCRAYVDRIEAEVRPGRWYGMFAAEDPGEPPPAPAWRQPATLARHQLRSCGLRWLLILSLTSSPIRLQDAETGQEAQNAYGSDGDQNPCHVCPWPIGEQSKVDQDEGHEDGQKTPCNS
jgi:hypothetical protein